MIYVKAGEAGTNDIVDEMWLVTDMSATMGNVEELFEIRSEAYGKRPNVTQTMIQVAGLMPEPMIEIKCIAKA